LSEMEGTRFSIFFLWLQSAQIFPPVYSGTKQIKKIDYVEF